MWGEARGIGWQRGIGWAVVLVWGSGLWAQPMPWPADLAEEPRPASSGEEPPPTPPVAELPGAQPAPSPAGEPSGPSAKEIRELKPSLYYLKDKQGNLQPVPGFTLEEFRELYELKHLLEQKAQPPSYSVQSVDIQGEVRGRQADLRVQVRVFVRDSVVRIPVGLKRMAVRELEGTQEGEPGRSASSGGQSEVPQAAANSPPKSASASRPPASGRESAPGQLPPASSGTKSSPGSVAIGSSHSPAIPPPYAGTKAAGADAKPSQVRSQEAPTEYLLHWEEGGEGYVVWILGGAGRLHRLQFQGTVPVQQVGHLRRLRFGCVRTPVSQMDLRIPGQGWKVEALDPATFVEVVPRGDSQTEVHLEGIGPEVEVRWEPAGPAQQARVSALEVTGETLVRVERDRIISQANLLVKGLAQPYDQIEIQVPQAIQFHPNSMSEASLIQEKENRIRVHFSTKALEHRLRLEWEQSISPEEWLELGGLEVLGAVKHRGHVAVWGNGDWHLLLRTSGPVRQTEQLPPSLTGEGLLAGFEYTGQPYSIRARLVAQQVRVSVEPEYRLWISAREVRMDGVFKCTIRGGKVEGFRVEMPGWELEELGPEELVAEPAIQMDNALLEIPLQQPIGGHVEITLTAHRPIPPSSKQLVVSLPQHWQVEWPPGGEISLLPASVLIIPEDNVQLVPEEKQMVGWVRQLPANFTDLPKRQQPILAYRSESGGGNFVAGFRVHAKQVQVEGTAHIGVEEEGVQVEQKLSYSISYEPLSTLLLRLPPSFPASGVEFVVDGQRVSPWSVAGASGEAKEAASVQWAIPLPQPRIGLCDLTIRYRLSAEPLLPNQSQLRSVGLVLPAEGKWLGWQVRITSEKGLQVKLREERWKPMEEVAGPVNKETQLLLKCPEPASEISLGVYRQQAKINPVTIIPRAFIHTWWTPLGREDRAVYRLRGEAEELRVRLPEGINPAEVEVWLDGQPSKAFLGPEGELSVALPAEKSEVVLEIRYHFHSPPPPRGHLQVVFPRLDGAVWVQRLYWLCQFPRNEHLIINPPGFSPEYQWKWNGWSWGRVPLWSLRDLERWVGAASWWLPPASTNNYLFSTMGHPAVTTVYTAGRSVLVFTASLAALGVGLLAIYIPLFRHPAWLLLVGIGLAGATALYPEQTVLLVQASMLGVVLAALAGWLQRRILRRQEAGMLALGTLDQESTQRQYPALVVGSTSATQAVRSPSPSPVSESS